MKFPIQVQLDDILVLSTLKVLGHAAGHRHYVGQLCAWSTPREPRDHSHVARMYGFNHAISSSRS